MSYFLKTSFLGLDIQASPQVFPGEGGHDIPTLNIRLSGPRHEGDRSAEMCAAHAAFLASPAAEFLNEHSNPKFTNSEFISRTKGMGVIWFEGDIQAAVEMLEQLGARFERVEMLPSGTVVQPYRKPSSGGMGM